MTAFTFADQARQFERSASLGLAYEAQERMARMQVVLNDLARNYRELAAIVGSDDRITDARDGLRDMAMDVQGECRPLIEDSGLLADFTPLDLGELA